MPEAIEVRFQRYVSPCPETGCWLWTGAASDFGYGRITWLENGRTKSVSTHRLAWRFAHGEDPPAGLCVLHRCDVPSCVNPDHLFLGTLADNARDRDEKGRGSHGDRHFSRTRPELLARGDRNGSRLHLDSRPRGATHGFALHPEARPRGMKHGRALLTDEKVREIRARASEGYDALAAAFGVGRSTIGYVLRRVTWRHVA